MRQNLWLKPLKIVVIYFLVSTAWIYFSDQAVLLLSPNPETTVWVSIYKGLGFVIGTSLLIYGLLVAEERLTRSTEAKLNESRSSFQSLFSGNPLPCWVYDAGSYRFLAVNEAAVRLYGYSQDEFLANTILDIRPAEDRARLADFFHENASGPLEEGKWQHRRKNGEAFDAMVSSYQIMFDGRPATLAVVNDLSIEQHAQEALKSETLKRQALEEIMDSGQTVVIVWQPVGNWPIQRTTKNMSFFGYTQEEFASGENHYADLIHPDDLEVLRALVAEWTARRLREFSREYRIFTRSGDVRWVEDRSLVDYDRDGRPIQVTSLLWDITERKIEEEEKNSVMIRLQNSERRLTDIVNFLPDATFVIDTAGCIIMWNRGMEEFTGVPAEVILGMGNYEHTYRVLHERHPVLIDFTLAGSLEAAKQYYPDVHIKRGIFEAETSIGDGRELAVKASPLYDTDGNIIGAIEIIRDISIEKEAEKILFADKQALEERVNERTLQLEEINRELEAFSYSVSHDLRAPLRHIDGFARALLEDYGPVLGPDGIHYLERIRSGSGNMSELIDAMLKLSRITRTDLLIDRVDLSEIAESIMNDYRNQEPNRHVLFECAHGISVDGDAKMMRVMMENLLNNAWKFTSKTDPAKIEFGQSLEDGKRVYFVRDNGAGFDATYAGKLFGAFQRLHSNNEFPGTGIGLATVSRIVHRHNGRIWAEGAAGKGATFYFEL
jgi:PAS domain S-box-containing protein